VDESPLYQILLDDRRRSCHPWNDRSSLRPSILIEFIKKPKGATLSPFFSGFLLDYSYSLLLISLTARSHSCRAMRLFFQKTRSRHPRSGSRRNSVEAREIEPIVQIEKNSESVANFKQSDRNPNPQREVAEPFRAIPYGVWGDVASKRQSPHNMRSRFGGTKW